MHTTAIYFSQENYALAALLVSAPARPAPSLAWLLLAVALTILGLGIDLAWSPMMGPVALPLASIGLGIVAALAAWEVMLR